MNVKRGISVFQLSLSSPILLESQLLDLVASTGYSLSELQAIADHAVPSYRIVTTAIGEYKPFDLLPLLERDGKDWRFASLSENIPVSCTAVGTRAILWICQNKHINIEPLTSIHIPISVFSRCTPQLWYDISSLFALIQNRNRRLCRLKEMNAPDIIIYAEEKMLWEGIELLESTYIFGKPYYRPDNTITRGLNTIGYSLLNGWNDPEMDEE